MFICRPHPLMSQSQHLPHPKSRLVKWHHISTVEALSQSGSRVEGLSEDESIKRRDTYGRNELITKKRKPAWVLFLAQFKDVMILILMGAAIISGLVGEGKDAAVILIIVLLNAVVGFLQEYRAEKAMEALTKISAPSATAVRNGKSIQLSASMLVPGDVVRLEAGNMVPADLRILESHSLQIEEASLTGESQAVTKNTEALLEEHLMLGDRTNMAYKSTIVTYGRGLGLVVATGMQTQIGQIAQMLQEQEVLTPLQRRLADFSKKLSLYILGICVILFTTGLLRDEEPFKILLVSISVAVAAIPEALPAVVTIALSLGARRMVNYHALVRKLPAVETLGSVTVICTDKTGTLTQNRMTVTEIWHPTPPVDETSLTPKHLLLVSMALNHDVREDENGHLTGESTECALVHFANHHPELAHFKGETYPRVAELPFDSDRKMMTTVHQYQDGFLIISKGALESILAASDEPNKAIMIEEAERMGKKGLRVLAYGYRFTDTLPDNPSINNLEQQLQISGLAAMIDPPREGVKEAIQACKTAGIIPVMITGDHYETAKAIAGQLGIISSGKDLIVNGADLQKMSAHEFEEKIERIKVYARVSPQQKLEIVKTLQKRGQYVAMTGDGVNDAPALRRANIGVAMGIAGTDVAKEAAHIILLNDNFATIVHAVKEGRRIFDNIRRFIKYIMTGNSGEIWTIILAPLAGMPIPLLPLHILWVNLVTDGLPALALANEPPGENIMQLPPRKPDESIFAHGLGLHILWVGLLIGAICLGVQAWAMQAGNPKWQTYVFTILCFSQMGHVLAIRSDYFFLFRQGIFTNLPLIGAVLLTFCLHLAILYIPALNDIFSVQPLTWKELIGCLLVSSVVFHAVEMEKLVRSWRQKNRISD